MNTKEMVTTFQDVPSVANLFRALWKIIREWIAARIQSHRYKKLDFHEVKENEISEKTRKAIEAARNAPDEDFISI